MEIVGSLLITNDEVWLLATMEIVGSLHCHEVCVVATMEIVGSLHITNHEVWFLATMVRVLATMELLKVFTLKVIRYVLLPPWKMWEVSTFQIMRYGFLPPWKMCEVSTLHCHEVWLLATTEIVRSLHITLS